MKMHPDDVRLIRCLLADIHEPLNLLFPGIRARAHTMHQGETLAFRVDYEHPKLGVLGFCHEAPLYYLSTMGREGMVRCLMQEIPRRVMDGLLVKAQQYSQSNWYSK
uniref:Uncharacterized protein n=1 Tax=Pseudomonas phage vB_PaPhi_Mx1 TaxID=3079664 RepID=A0AAU0N301_9CAUD